MERNRYDLLHARAREHPDVPALVTPEEVLTYAALDRRVSLLAGRLRTHGCAAGTRVALYLPRDGFMVMLLLALWRLGATACLLSVRTPPGALTPMLEKIMARVLITADSVAAKRVSPTVHLLDPALWAETEAPTIGPVPPAAWPFDRPATIIFTSGSTGAPKAALHTIGNHYFSAKGSNTNIALQPGDRWLLSLPLYHVGGLAILFRCLLAGAAVAVPSVEATIGAALVQQKATHVSMVATQLRRLLWEEAFREGYALKAVLLGGGPLPAGLLSEARARGWTLYASYGCTEMSSQVATTMPGDGLEALHTAGRVLAHRELKLAADGEILVRGRTCFRGYVDGERLEQPFDGEGWFHTGDVGTYDSAGRLRVEGRKDYRFISGGENIQPEEIEAALGRLDTVEQAVVVPVPDETFGQRPVAFVRTNTGAVPEDLAEHLEVELPRFKIPDAFLPWPEEQRAGLKVDRAFFEQLAKDE